MAKNDSPCLKFSQIYEDYGSKYIQEYVPGITPSNVLEWGDKGIRMEDCIRAEKIGENIIAIVIADGHGSDRMIYGYHVGGYECAKLSTNVCISNLELLKDVKTPEIEKSFKKLMRDIFREIQRESIKELMKGCTKEKSNKPPSCFYTFKKNESPSVIDGAYFETICDPKKFKVWEEIYLKYYTEKDYLIIKERMVTGKIFDQNKDENNATFNTPVYIDRHGDRTDDLESGCTLTSCLLLRMPNGDIKLMTAHIGDSSVLLYRKVGENSWEGIKITDDHSTTNPSEIERCKKMGLVACDRYFKVAKNQSRGLMPSRSIGHPYLSRFGIIEDPYITSETLKKGDIVVFASDGLWDATDTAMEDIARIISLVYEESADNIAHFLHLYYLGASEFRDNLSFIVLKVE